MIARATFTRIRVSAVQARFLSTQGETALRKFQQVMQEYRIANYSQCTPRRFKKEVVAAAKDSENRIVLANLQKVLNNIGAGQKMTDEELQLIFAEVGDANGIPADRLATLF